MNDWYRKYQEVYYRIRYLSVVGNVVIFGLVVKEIWWFGTVFAGPVELESHMIPHLSWQLSAHFVVAGLCLFRVASLFRFLNVRFISLLLSGLLCCFVLLISWADAIDLWTCYVSNPKSILCSTYVFGRPDVLAGIGPIYFFIGLVKTIAISICVNVARNNELNTNS